MEKESDQACKIDLTDHEIEMLNFELNELE